MAYNGDFNVTLICHKGKTSTPSFPWDNATDLELADLVTALDGITLATIGKQFVVERREVAAGSAATPPGTASRGKKFVLKYRDAVTNDLHQVEIAGGNDGLLTAGSDDIPLDSGPGLAVKTAFDSHVVTKAGNASVLYAITFDTRNIE